MLRLEARLPPVAVRLRLLAVRLRRLEARLRRLAVRLSAQEEDAAAPVRSGLNLSRDAGSSEAFRGGGHEIRNGLLCMANVASISSCPRTGSLGEGGTAGRVNSICCRALSIRLMTRPT